MPAMTIPAAAIARAGFRVYFNRLDARAANLEPVWDHVRRIIWDAETAVFKNEGAVPGFPRWTRLTDRYAAWKRGKFGNRKMLAISGKLRGQLTGKVAGWYEERHPHSFALGSDYTDFSGVAGRPRSPGDSLRGRDLGGIHAEGRQTSPKMVARMPIEIGAQTTEAYIVDRIVDLSPTRTMIGKATVALGAGQT